MLSRQIPTAQSAFLEPQNARNVWWKNDNFRKTCIPQDVWLFRRSVRSSPNNEHNQPQELSCIPSPDPQTPYRHLQQVTDVKELTRNFQKKTKKKSVLWKVTPRSGLDGRFRWNCYLLNQGSGMYRRVTNWIDKYSTYTYVSEDTDTSVISVYSLI
jgi:hypothetical protein